jgi:hypothetical protein
MIIPKSPLHTSCIFSSSFSITLGWNWSQSPPPLFNNQRCESGDLCSDTTFQKDHVRIFTHIRLDKLFIRYNILLKGLFIATQSYGNLNFLLHCCALVPYTKMILIKLILGGQDPDPDLEQEPVPDGQIRVQRERIRFRSATSEG